MSKKFKKNQPLPRFVLLLLACLSGFIGITFAYFLMIAPIYGLWKTRDLVQVPAAIKKWELIVSKGSSRSAASVSVKAEYEYQYEGIDYIGNRVSLFKYDNEVYYDYLNKTEALCFIDPNDPSYSVIHRQFNLSWLIFVLVIPTLLLSICVISIGALIKTKKPQIQIK
jgi:hypothetical protein